jgi:hypothetical protein
MGARRHRAAALLLTLVAWSTPAYAQQAGPSASLDLPFAYDGPPPPELPLTMVRDSEGKTTVRAIHLDRPLDIDGRLDEALYTAAMPISDFVMSEPVPDGAPTEKTDVWISYDSDYVYVSVHAYESQPDRMILNEMRRDSEQLLQNENFAFAFDTFYDRRNSFNFSFSPLGGRMDAQNTNEGQYNGDWNPVWDLAVRRVEGGWTGEAAVPFKSIRYRGGRMQVWGVQLRRINRWKNEISHLTHVPGGNNSMNAWLRASTYATLVGIEVPSRQSALDLKPYVTSSLASDSTATPRLDNDLGGDLGFDVKYGLTQTLTADFTYNTDFAQVEADEQQVNLTRFSLFFPEKREFFLENQGIFSFGGVNANNRGENNDSPLLFYSRRIGLDRGGIVPLEAGGRLTGRVGRYTVGMVNIQSDDVTGRGIPSTNFAVARVKRDILRRSAIGAMYTRRSHSIDGAGDAETYGVDATFGFFDNVSLQGFLAQSKTPLGDEDNYSYRAQFGYTGDRYNVYLIRMHVGDNFNPEVGFLRRDDFTRSFAQFRFTPRPQRRFRSVRKFRYQGSINYIESSRGRLDFRDQGAEFGMEFQNSDVLEVTYANSFEFLPGAFAIAHDVLVPQGGYDLRTARAAFTLGQQRRVSGTVFTEGGRFYSGTRAAFGFNAARVMVLPQLAVEPGVSFNRVSLPYGEFTANLVTSRVTYTVTPMMFVTSLVQYNSTNRSLSTNVRLRWEYRPGSELFVVYNEGRDTLTPGYPTLQQRAFIVKVNRLFRF